MRIEHLEEANALRKRIEELRKEASRLSEITFHKVRLEIRGRSSEHWVELSPNIAMITIKATVAELGIAARMLEQKLERLVGQ